MRYNNKYNKYNREDPHGKGNPYDRNKKYCITGFPDYPSVNSLYEHFRVMKIISRWGPPGVPPAPLLNHFDLQIQKFHSQKPEHMRKVHTIRQMLKKFDRTSTTVIKKTIEKRKTIANQNIHQSYSEESETKKGKIGFFSFLLAIIISLTSLVILVDTFKVQLSSIIPNIDFYLVSLRDTLKDIFLFFTDLFK